MLRQTPEADCREATSIKQKGQVQTSGSEMIQQQHCSQFEDICGKSDVIIGFIEKSCKR